MNVAGYLQSRECVLADDLTMAFSSNDIEKLDKVKKLPEVNYLDFEVQRLCKGLSLFDSIYTDDTPISAKQPVSGAKAGSTSSKNSAGSSSGGGSKIDLFGTPKPATASPNTGASVRNTPPPPPPPPSSGSGAPSPARPTPPPAPADLDSIDIPGETGSDLGDQQADAEVDLDNLHIDGEPNDFEYSMEPLVDAVDGAGIVQKSRQIAHIADVKDVPQEEQQEEEEEDEIDLS